MTCNDDATYARLMRQSARWTLVMGVSIALGAVLLMAAFLALGVPLVLPGWALPVGIAALGFLTLGAVANIKVGEAEYALNRHRF